jgi:thioredoxin type arsenate reductase
MTERKRVLFLCTGNSARSQMAEGLLRHIGGEAYDVFSAGVAPSSVRPEAIVVMREIGIDISQHRSKSVDEFTGRQFDYVITVCDNAKEQCPVFPGAARRLHWSFDDPAAAGGDEAARLAVFRRVRDEIAKQIMTYPFQMLEVWEKSAKYWTQHSHTIHAMFAPLTRAMIESVQIREGESVLDVAGGAGEPSLTIAETVGPTGSVTCTDATAGMVEAALREANRRGLTNMQFRQCTADSLPFPDNSFDVVVSRLGVMFFPDTIAAFREMLRVLRPKGRLAFAVWGKSELNPFCYIVSGVVEQHVKAPPPDPNAPNAFRFAEPGKLTRRMTEAGVQDAEEHVVKFDIAAPISAEQFWAMRSQTSDTLREKLATLGPEEQAEVAAEVEGAVREFFPDNQMKFPAQLIIATGKKG